MLRVRPNLIAGTGVAAAAAFFGAGLPFIDAAGGYAGLSQRFLPAVVTLGLALCAVLLLAARDSVPAVAEDADEVVEPGRGPARLAWTASGLLLHAALVGTIGFVLAGALLMALVARGFASARPLRDALSGLALTVPMWLVFTRVLGIALPLFPLAGL